VGVNQKGVNKNLFPPEIRG